MILLLKKGWSQMEEFAVGDQKIMVVCGFATINDPPSTKNVSRSHLSQFLTPKLTEKSKIIQENIITALQQGFGKR